MSRILIDRNILKSIPGGKSKRKDFKSGKHEADGGDSRTEIQRGQPPHAAPAEGSLGQDPVSFPAQPGRRSVIARCRQELKK